MATAEQIKAFDDLMQKGLYKEAADYGRNVAGASDADIATYVGGGDASKASQAKGFLDSYQSPKTQQPGQQPVNTPVAPVVTTPQPAPNPTAPPTQPQAPDPYYKFIHNGIANPTTVEPSKPSTPSTPQSPSNNTPAVNANVGGINVAPWASPGTQITAQAQQTQQVMTDASKALSNTLLKGSKYSASDPHVLAGQTFASAALGTAYGAVKDPDSLAAAYQKRKAAGGLSTNELSHWKTAAYLMGIDPANLPEELKNVPYGLGNNDPNSPYGKALVTYAKAAGVPEVTDRNSLIAAYDKRLKSGTPISDMEAENWQVAAALAGIDTTGIDLATGKYIQAPAYNLAAGETPSNQSVSKFVDPNSVKMYGGLVDTALYNTDGRQQLKPADLTTSQANLFKQYLAAGDYTKAAELGRSYGFKDADIAAYVGALNGGESSDAGKAVASATAQYLFEHPAANKGNVQDQLKTIQEAKRITPIDGASLQTFKSYLDAGDFKKAAQFARSFGYNDQEITQYVAALSGGMGSESGQAVARATAQYLFENPAADKTTVQDQMKGLLDYNSSYIQNARNNAAMQANGRGLLNSSIAAGAGEQAAIQSALPIAQQDATSALNQRLATQQYDNQAAQQNATAFNQQTLANQQAQNQAALAKYNADSGLYNAQQNAHTDYVNKGALQDKAFLNDKALSNQGYEQQKGLTGYQAQLDAQKNEQVAKLQLDSDRQKAFLQLELSKQQNILDIAKIDVTAAHEMARAQLDAETRLKAAIIGKPVDTSGAQVAAAQINANAEIEKAKIQAAANDDRNYSEEKRQEGVNKTEIQKQTIQSWGQLTATSNQTDANIMNNTQLDYSGKVQGVTNNRISTINSWNSFLARQTGQPPPPAIQMPNINYSSENLRYPAIVYNEKGYADLSYAPNTSSALSTTTSNQPIDFSPLIS